VPFSTFFEFYLSSEFHLITSAIATSENAWNTHNNRAIECNCHERETRENKIGVLFLVYTVPQMNASQSDFVMTRHSICFLPTRFLDERLDCGKQHWLSKGFSKKWRGSLFRVGRSTLSKCF
jgi:hypothetical protein